MSRGVVAVGGRVEVYGEGWHSVSGNASNVKSSWVEWAVVSHGKYG